MQADKWPARAFICAMQDQLPSGPSCNIGEVVAPFRQPAEISLTQRICLIGLRGAGKSTLGRRAAEKLKIPFLELKDIIEKQAGMPVAEVMALYGQDGYRRLEADALDTIVDSHDKMILAVAGGIVADGDVFTQVIERFHTVWIRTSAAEHMARVRAQGDLRPMEGNPAAMDQLKALLRERTPQYERALVQIDTSNKPIQTSVNDLLAAIAKHRFLDMIGAE